MSSYTARSPSLLHSGYTARSPSLSHSGYTAPSPSLLHPEHAGVLICLTHSAPQPSKYGPIAYGKAKEKMIEWNVADKALELKSKATSKIGEAYSSAAASPAGLLQMLTH